MKIEMRNYQIECLDKIKNNNRKKMLIVLPTGCGKTIIFAHLPKILPGRTLIIAHREELLDQAFTKMKWIDESYNIGIEQAKRMANIDNDIVIGSIQTLKNEKRLERLGKFDNLIIDEAHHASAKTYKDLYKKVDPEYVIGFTATPKRADNKGLNYIFEDVVYTKTIEEMIRSRWLVNIRAYKIYIDWNLSNIKKSQGDYNVKQLDEAINTVDLNLEVYLSIKKYIENRKCVLLFAVNINHVESLYKVFTSKGLSVTYIHGNLSSEERKQRLSDFKNGKYKIMINCMILTEGFDFPAIDCIVLARPTQSSVLYIQMIGRGTRTCENKNDLLILDIVGNSDFHKNGLSKQFTVNDLFDIPQKLQNEGEDILDVKDKLEKLQQENPYLDKLSCGNLNDYVLRAEKIDLFSICKAPSEIASVTNFAWNRIDSNTYRLDLNDNQYCQVKVDTLGHSKVYWNTINTNRIKIFYKSFDNVELAINNVETYIREIRSEWLPLVNLNSKWRDTMPSDKQLEFLKKLFEKPKNKNKIKNISLESITKGEAARLITVLKLNK